MDKAKVALNELITARAADLASREKVVQGATRRLATVEGELVSAQRERDRAQAELRQVCLAYFPLIEGKVLMSDHPCNAYAAEYQRMLRKASEVD